MPNWNKKYAYIYNGCPFMGLILVVGILPIGHRTLSMAYILFGIAVGYGMISKKRKITLIGAIGGGISSLLQTIYILASLTEPYPIVEKNSLIRGLISVILLIGVFVLIVIANKKEESSQKLINTSVLLLSTAMVLALYTIFQELSELEVWIALIVNALLSGMIWYVTMVLPKILIKQIERTQQVSAKISTDKIEKITQLKKLLDEDMITQEEFDEKKKQLLDQ